MAKKTLSEMSLEELQKSSASSKGILIAFSLLWLIVIGIFVYIGITRPNGLSGKLPAFLPVIVTAIPTMIPILIHFSNIRKEVKKRQFHS